MKRVVVIAATNAPQAIDSAFLRPGRFDRVVPVPPPDANGNMCNHLYNTLYIFIRRLVHAYGIDCCVVISLPTSCPSLARAAILQVLTERMPLAEDVDLKSVGDLTRNFTGADLAGLCRQVFQCLLFVSFFGRFQLVTIVLGGNCADPKGPSKDPWSSRASSKYDCDNARFLQCSRENNSICFAKCTERI